MATGLSPQQAAKPSKTEAYVATHIDEVQRRYVADCVDRFVQATT